MIEILKFLNSLVLEDLATTNLSSKMSLKAGSLKMEKFMPLKKNSKIIDTMVLKLECLIRVLKKF